MKGHFSDYIVALSVVACSVILLAALSMALSGYRLKKPTRTFHIDYEDATGLKLHSEVRYAGAPAGRVIAMRHLNSAERGALANKKDIVRVTISVENEVPPLPNDVTATISSDNLLANKFVALSAGTPGRAALANNSSIPAMPTYGLEQIIPMAGPLLVKADKLLDDFEGTVTELHGNLSDLLPKLSSLVDSLKTDVDDLQTAVAGLNGVAKDADDVLGSAGRFIHSTDTQIHDEMQELHVTLLNLKVITTHAKAITQELGERPNRLIFGGKPNKLTPEAEIIRSSKPLPAKSP
jgi:ABC-type transporter Mla subunit MlaD